LQICHGAECDQVRETLEKIVGRFPVSAVGEMAQMRPERLKLELKGQEETPGVKPGVYGKKSV
jgi:hypothetical protein